MKAADKRGQITVFLSLVFLLMLSLALCVLEGMRGYLQTALAEDAFKGAGDEVLANYSNSLHERYHIFFLDPREKEYMLEDARNYLNMYFDSSSFYGLSCQELEITDEKTAVGEGGLYLKHQIREWMKYREAQKAGKALKQLFHSMTGIEEKAENEVKAIGEAEEENEKMQDDSQEDDSGEGRLSGKEAPKEKSAWKNLRGTLKKAVASGVLMYAAQNPSELSHQGITKEGLPSQEFSKSGAESLSGEEKSISFNSLKEWKNLIEDGNFSEPAVNALADDYYVLNYILECYHRYRGKESDKVSALQYEAEYLIGGKSSDIDNLKYVANQIMLLRFLTNYAYANSDAGLRGKADAMALALAGAFGLPQVQNAVRVLMIAALSYGESLLELHTLMAGGEIAVIKDPSTWNITFENAATLLKEKRMVKTGKPKAGYEDFIKLFLAMRMKNSSLYYRMMDIMQLNVNLDEPGFMIRDSLFSFYWKGKIRCARWFNMIPGTQHGGGSFINMEFERRVSY